ncbi:hypothetical protein BU23DRAFT_575048 [Bimuria novae-zelandiae CBS 107.79]|uniref:Uncharacterized protein n=1 Tax=Bimuria novae-zelandiae CBS 107.79 TaxID=1447943 RepID=A0A6A5UJY4_9PLEO|nr:hypothetical protein BU23DRAFT_575048 [Bimuria novae-zelandiae CBS 107.79]
MKTGLKNALIKIKRAPLCCRKGDRKCSPDIGSLTDVRHMDITKTMPNLSEADKRFIGEKACHDATHMYSLHSHPPTLPSTPTTPLTDPFASNPLPSQTRLPTPSRPLLTNREPLLNAASTNPPTNPPTNLPTPPHHSLSETSPPARPTKSMWDRTRRLSTTLSHRSSVRSSAGYRGLAPSSRQEDGEGEGVVMLELDLEGKGDGGSVDMDGFEMQRTVGDA